MTITLTRPRIEKVASDHGWFWRSNSSKSVLLDAVRRHASPFLKKADAAGGSPDEGFEQSFSSLAYSYIKSKSPRLLDYIIGFQLVERNEDDTKSMGVFGCKVGDQWLYLPVFFLNGDLKGHEMMYVKNKNTFLPMKENWVNYVISRKPHILGEGSPKDSYQLGGLPADIYRLTHPPSSSKYGSDKHHVIQEWAVPFLNFIGAAATKNASVFAKHAALCEELDLKKFLKTNFTLLKVAFDMSEKYPLFKDGLTKFYGNIFQELGEEFRKIASDTSVFKQAGSSCSMSTPKKKTFKRGNSILAEEAPKERNPIKTGALKIALLDFNTPHGYKFASSETNKVDMEAPGGITENLDELDDDERKKLLSDTILIKDKRDPHAVSEVYNTQVRLELTNPGDTAIYEVLEKPGDFDDMLVIMHPSTNKGKETFATVVRMSDPKNWLNIHTSRLWVQASPKPDREDFDKWFKKLPESKEMKKGGHYMAVGSNGEATTPFKVRQVHGDEVYTVDFKDYCAWGKDRPTWQRHTDTYSDPMTDEYISSYDARLFFNERDGSKLHATHGELSVPKHFKIFKLKDPPPPPKPGKGDSIFCCGEGSSDAGSEDRPIKPGDIGDIHLMINEKTSQLKVLDVGGDVYIKSSSTGFNERLSRKNALINLIRDHGLSEKSAREVLKDAAANAVLHKSAVYRIKYAEGYPGPNSHSMLEGGPSMPGFPMPPYGSERVGPSSYPAIYPQEEFHQIPDMMSSRTDPMIYDPFYQPDQRAMQMAQEASQSGQKEIFDAASIAGMLKAVPQDALVDRHLPILIKCIDKVLRILFMFYWHQEEFEDRYGKQDLPELEDSLRNTAESLGDLTLFLLEKQVGGGFLGEGMGGSGNKSEPSIEESARN